MKAPKIFNLAAFTFLAAPIFAQTKTVVPKQSITFNTGVAFNGGMGLGLQFGLAYTKPVTKKFSYSIAYDYLRIRSTPFLNSRGSFSREYKNKTNEHYISFLGNFTLIQKNKFSFVGSLGVGYNYNKNAYYSENYPVGGGSPVIVKNRVNTNGFIVTVGISFNYKINNTWGIGLGINKFYGTTGGRLNNYSSSTNALLKLKYSF